jgi:sigma-B regulation protein RsbU (phosphoserine phosphatase)
MDEINILLADDSEVTHMAVEEIISSYPYHLIKAYDGKEAIRKLGNNPVDLILSDITMPNKGGFEFCELTKANPQFKDIPFIFLTASGNEDDILTGLELGANDYIVKPFNEDELLMRIKTQLRIAEQQKEIANQQASKHHNALIATLNHELNNSLAIIDGSFEHMKKKKKWDEAKAEHIKQNIDHIVKVLKQLRETNSSFSYTQYSGDTLMLSLNDKD